MASRLAEGIRAAGGRLLWPVEANELFPILKKSQFERLEAAGAKLYEWPVSATESHLAPGEDEVALRLVCSFATSETEVEGFLAEL